MDYDIDVKPHSIYSNSVHISSMVDLHEQFMRVAR